MSKTIFCVLRSGGRDYDERHVRWLKRQCDAFAPNVPFVCLTDLPSIEGVETEALHHDWEGWWAKLELFRFDDVFYLDLDSVLLSDISHMMTLGGFHALRNFGRNGLRGRLGRFVGARIPLATGMMSWEQAPRHLYKSFDPAITARYQRPTSWGDQGYVFERLKGDYIAFQDVFPGRIKSFKFDALDERTPDADVVCFHGRPRPWEAGADWVPQLDPAP